jgi:phage-related protein
MATFTYIPDYPPNESSEPRVRKTEFGDGYEHRIRFGLNTDLPTWDLEFMTRDATETAGIRSFLKARGAVESFTWTPPFFNATASQFVCDKWSIVAVAHNIFDIRAAFRQVAEPS